MSLEQAQLSIQIFQDFVKALKLAWDEGRGVWTSAQISQIVQSLRKVYFPDSGSLSVLEKAAHGQNISKDVAETQLAAFDRDEPAVREALRKLSFAATAKRGFLTLQMVNNLDSIALGKIEARQGVRDVLSRIASGKEVNHQEIVSLAEKIKSLNAAVNELDATLNK